RTVASEGLRRLVGDDVHRAARAVATIQGTLRAIQHLDTLYVEEQTIQRGEARVVVAVDVHRIRRVEGRSEGPCTDAADADVVELAGRDGDFGRDPRDIG